MRLRHGRIGLELHNLREGQGTPLLLLHELYGSAADWGAQADAWTGPIHALDFCGHGGSDHVLGGAYHAELLVADADTALAHLGRAAIVGKGVGAYVALLLAGARSDEICAALLAPGRGDAGGGERPDPEVSPFRHSLPPSLPVAGADPRVRVLESDVRPLDYARPFADAARLLWLLEDGSERPPWWIASRRAPGAREVRSDLTRAIHHLGETVAD